MLSVFLASTAAARVLKRLCRLGKTPLVLTMGWFRTNVYAILIHEFHFIDLFQAYRFIGSHWK